MSCVVGFGVIISIEDFLSKYGFESIDELEHYFEEAGLSIIMNNDLAFVAFENTLQTFNDKKYFYINMDNSPTEEEEQTMIEYTEEAPRLIVFALETGLKAVKEALEQIEESLSGVEIDL